MSLIDAFMESLKESFLEMKRVQPEKTEMEGNRVEKWRSLLGLPKAKSKPNGIF